MPASPTPTRSTASPEQTRTAMSVLDRVVDDLAMIVDRSFSVSGSKVERIDRRAAGSGRVHISFKLRFEVDGDERYGALLVPLPDAIALACYLMMMPDDAVADRRGDVELDQSTKDAILEVGNFVGGAVDAVLREVHGGDVRAKSAGCQGVRAGVRPAFPYVEGTELTLASGTARLHEFQPFEILLMLPDLEVE